MTPDPSIENPAEPGTADSEQGVPPANPAYATPPPEGLPDADRD